MRDKISLDRAKLLHPKISREVIDIITELEKHFPVNMAIRIAQGLRTFAEQTALYQKGRRGIKGESIVTKAKAGSSFHQYGLATDFCLLHDKDGNGSYEELSWDTLADFDKDKIPDWNEVVKAFENKGYSWGGSWRTFKDLPHVEKSFGYKVATLLAMYNAKKFIPGTQYLQL